MVRMFPDTYWDPTGKRGIIDTGKTVEFWLKPFGYTVFKDIIQTEGLFLKWYKASQSTAGRCPLFNPRSHKIFLELKNDVLQVVMEVPLVGSDTSGLLNEKMMISTENGKGRYCIGQVPSNSNIHRILMKKLDTIKPGRVVKLQTAPTHNMKVRLPYGIYIYNQEDRLVIDYSRKSEGRFNDLMIEDK